MILMKKMAALILIAGATILPFQSANAWWEPWNNGWGFGDFDMSFGIRGSGHGGGYGSGYGNGYGQYYNNYYGGYAPYYGYTPYCGYGLAPYAVPAPQPAH